MQSSVFFNDGIISGHGCYLVQDVIRVFGHVLDGHDGKEFDGSKELLLSSLVMFSNFFRPVFLVFEVILPFIVELTFSMELVFEVSVDVEEHQGEFWNGRFSRLRIIESFSDLLDVVVGETLGVIFQIVPVCYFFVRQVAAVDDDCDVVVVVRNGLWCWCLTSVSWFRCEVVSVLG